MVTPATSKHCRRMNTGSYGRALEMKIWSKTPQRAKARLYLWLDCLLIFPVLRTRNLVLPVKVYRLGKVKLWELDQIYPKKRLFSWSLIKSKREPRRSCTDTRSILKISREITIREMRLKDGTIGSRIIINQSWQNCANRLFKKNNFKI